MRQKISYEAHANNLEISEKPKFVREKMEERTELNCIKAEWAWRQEDIPPSVEEPLSTFVDKYKKHAKNLG